METPKRDRVRGRLLSMMPKGGVCAEIGVWEGNFSERILNETEPKKLILIDPWLYQPEFSNTGFGRKKNETAMEERYLSVWQKFMEEPRVTTLRAFSDTALKAMPDHYLDWIYIDGNHNAPYIDNDLALALQKVKPNGIISGDDYNWQAEASGAPVKHAVERILADLGEKAEFKLMGNQYFIQLKRG